MSQQDELLSAIGVDYSQMRDLLVAGQWQKADQETGAIMLKIARRVTSGWLREEDIQEFPCPDLQTVDHLWIKYSQERFGFSVQSRIWEKVGEDYGRLGDSVGWRLYSSWQRYCDLTFNLLAPVGHLPAAPFFKSNEMAIGWMSSIPPKLMDCHTEDF